MKRKTRDNSWLHIEATLECLSFRSCRARTRDHERIFEFLFRIFSDLTTVDIETREKFRVISPYIFLFSTREDHRSRSKASSRYRRFGVSCPSSFEATQCVARAILACKRHPFVLLRFTDHQCYSKLHRRLDLAPMIDGVSKDVNVSSTVTYLTGVYPCRLLL